MEVTLVPFDTIFLETSWGWLQDDELRKLVDTPLPTKAQQYCWFETLSQRSDYHIWGVLYNDKPVGVTGIKNIQNSTGEYWGYIGNKIYWGKGIGNTMIQLTIAAAQSLQLKQLTLTVLRTNQRAIKLYTKNGFVQTQVNTVYLIMEKTLF